MALQFTFGEYMVDPDRWELTRGSEAIAIGLWTAERHHSLLFSRLGDR